MTWRGDAVTRLSSGSPCVFRAAEALARLLPRHPGLLPDLPHMTADTKITISKQNTYLPLAVLQYRMPISFT
jgi:hypothetical protein